MTNVPAMLAAVALGIPSLLWVHGVIDSLLLPGRSSEFAVPHDELLLHSATRVIALSNYTSDFCTRVMQRRRLDIIHNWTPVDPQFAAPAEKYHSRHFACLNTFDPHKGYATLLKAAALLKARKVFFELDLYGDGEVRGEMQRRAATLGLQDCVRFQGRTTHVHKVYDRSLGIVNPAQVEPFGMTLIEAMARKTPVVATRCGGPADIVVDGQSGYLVERGDAAAIADRMQALLESPELAQRLGEEGFRRVGTHFNEEAARAAFLPVIEEAVRDFRGYEPAVRTLTKMYCLWLDRAARAATPVDLGARAPCRHHVPMVVVGGPACPGRPAPQQGVGETRPGGARHRRSGAVRRSSTPRWSRTCSPAPSGAKAAVDPAGTPRKFQSLRRKIRYRLVPDCGNWSGLDVLVYCNPVLAGGRLRLCVRSASGQVLREAVSPLDGLGEKGWLGFRFAPIANAAGMPFDVEIVAENASPAAGIGICESDTHPAARPGAAPPFSLSRQRKALYCKTWHA